MACNTSLCYGIDFPLFVGFADCFWNAFHEFIVELPMCCSLCSASFRSALLPIPIQMFRRFSAACSFESCVCSYPAPHLVSFVRPAAEVLSFAKSNREK
jgi:hypothetical protein